MTMSTFAFLAHISVSNSFKPHFKLWWWCGFSSSLPSNVCLFVTSNLLCVNSTIIILRYLSLSKPIFYIPLPPPPQYLWIDREEYPRRWGGQGLARTQWVWEQCIPPCHLSILTHWTLCIYWFRHSQFCIFLPAFFHFCSTSYFTHYTTLFHLLHFISLM